MKSDEKVLVSLLYNHSHYGKRFRSLGEKTITFPVESNAKNLDDTRPGWGHGDKNHVHTGPPGQSVVIPPFSI